MGWFSSRKERPTAEDVAIRAAILRCVVSYAWTMPLPGALTDAQRWWTDDETRTFARESKRERDQIWSELGSNRKHLSPIEKALSATTPETITEQQITDATWRAEALGAILWSLNIVDRILPYDDGYDESAFIGAMITHTRSDRNAEMSVDHFKSKAENGKPFKITYDYSNLVKAKLFKLEDWGPFTMVGELTDQGIKFVEATIDHLHPETWGEYRQRNRRIS